MKKLFATLAAVFFIFASIPVFIFSGFSRTYLNKAFLTGPFTEELRQFTTDILSREIVFLDPVIRAHFSQTEARSLLDEAFPISVYRDIVDEFAVNLSSVVLERSGDVLNVSFQEFRHQIPVFLQTFSSALVKRLPICTATIIPSGDGGLLECTPPSVQQGEMEKSVEKELQEKIFSEVPEVFTVDLTQEGDGENFRQFYDMVRKIELFGPFVLLMFTFLIFLIIWKPFGLSLKYTGLALFGSGVLTSIMAGFLLTLPKFLKPEDFADGVQVYKYAVQFFEFFFRVWRDGVWRISIVVVFLGVLVMIFGRTLLKKVKGYDGA